MPASASLLPRCRRYSSRLTPLLLAHNTSQRACARATSSSFAYRPPLFFCHHLPAASLPPRARTIFAFFTSRAHERTACFTRLLPTRIGRRVVGLHALLAATIAVFAAAPVLAQRKLVTNSVNVDDGVYAPANHFRCPQQQ